MHFPWCRKLCPYCDFAVEVGAPPHEAYRDAVLVELARRASAFSDGERALASIYFGGGTPSLWEPACIADVIAAVRERWSGVPREVTIEANPTDCTAERLAAWRRAGISRISIGVQSLEPQALVTLGRDHRFGDGREAVARAIDAGFDVSADFILGVPGANEDVVALAPHLSVYELTIEERTAFGQRVRDGRLVPLDEELLEARYVAAHESLTAKGYEHYEISSYAMPGKRAVHNSLYWSGAPFLGLGVGAASLEVHASGAGARATNPRRWTDYASDPGEPAEKIVMSPSEMASDRAWLGMRTSDGVAEVALTATPGLADKLVTEGLAVRRVRHDVTYICPTLRGFLMADRIAARIVESWGDPGELPRMWRDDEGAAL
ncbi:MAG: coproporphyrinogen-III oxidase family protein [Kofleriaceae bacterium]